LNFKGYSCDCGKSCKGGITVLACNADETEKVLPLFSGKIGKHLALNMPKNFA
jgi:hypothetical protein